MKSQSNGSIQVREIAGVTVFAEAFADRPPSLCQVLRDGKNSAALEPAACPRHFGSVSWS